MTSTPLQIARASEYLVPLDPALQVLDAVVQVHPHVADGDQQVGHAHPDLERSGSHD